MNAAQIEAQLLELADQAYDAKEEAQGERRDAPARAPRHARHD